MTPVCDPARVVALVVGVEDSRIFELDPLIGPVGDAIACFDWLKTRMDPARIRLFVSPKPASLPRLEAWDAQNDEASRYEATENRLQHFLVYELPELAAKGDDALLLVVWSGHGLIEQRSVPRTRRLFYADSTPELQRHLDVARLLGALKGQRYAGFSQQVFVVDACAVYSGRVFGGKTTMCEPTPLSITPPDAGIRQWAMLAASPGQTAYVAGAAEAAGSRFIRRLFDELEPVERKRWPDFRAAFQRTQASFRESDQFPVSWASGDAEDNLSDDGRPVLGQASTTRLTRAVMAANLSDTLLKQCFVAALERAAMAETQALAMSEGVPAMVDLLASTARSPHPLSALQRFAAQVVLRSNGMVAVAEVLAWLKPAVDDAALQRYREEVAAAELHAVENTCFLLIDERPNANDADAVDLHAWLFVRKNPVPVLLTDDEAPITVRRDAPRADALGRLLGDAFDQALQHGVREPSIIFEFALPLPRIGEDVEAQTVDDGAGAGPVGHRYPVVRRIADRLQATSMARSPAGRRALPALFRWINAAKQLRTRFERHGLHVVWMDPTQVISGLLDSTLKAHPLGSCIGLEMAVSGGILTEQARDSLYAGAVPFACWSRDAWCNADQVRFDTDMADCLDHAALQKLFELKRDAGFVDHPSTRLAILWDDPSRNPYAEQLQAKGSMP